MNITKRCAQDLITPVDFMQPAKTHNFEFISDITLAQLKLRPIIDQTGTYIYKASKVVAKYLGPLAKNDYSIRDTLSFPDLLKNAPSDDNYEDVSYDVESLFTSIPVQETIDYILYKIYVKKELKPFCKKSIFKKLLNKLTTEGVFSANNRMIKQMAVQWEDQYLWFFQIFMFVRWKRI